MVKEKNNFFGELEFRCSGGVKFVHVLANHFQHLGRPQLQLRGQLVRLAQRDQQFLKLFLQAQDKIFYDKYAH